MSIKTLLSLFLLTAGLSRLYAQAIPEDKVYELYDLNKWPEFPGGRIAMLGYQSERIKTVLQQQPGLHGGVVVSFVIDKDGSISNINVEQSDNTGCSANAMRILERMPKWSPGEIKGVPVRSRFYATMKFEAPNAADQRAPVDERAPEYEEETINGERIYPLFEVTQAPAFPGGEEAMKKFIADKLQYPAEAKAKGIQGTVEVVFVVSTTGEISNLALQKMVSGGCGEEAMRIVKAMPRWVPGAYKGKIVNVRTSINIDFTIK